MQVEETRSPHSPSPAKVFHHTCFAMNTRFSLVLVGVEAERAEALARAAERDLRACGLNIRGRACINYSLPSFPGSISLASVILEGVEELRMLGIHGLPVRAFVGADKIQRVECGKTWPKLSRRLKIPVLVP